MLAVRNETVMSVMPASRKRRGRRRPIPAVLHSVTKGKRNLPRSLLVRRVTELRFPVKVLNRHAAASFEHADHFGEGFNWIRNVHQHSLRAHGVKGLIGEPERPRVADFEADRKVPGGRATN